MVTLIYQEKHPLLTFFYLQYRVKDCDVLKLLSSVPNAQIALLCVLCAPGLQSLLFVAQKANLLLLKLRNNGERVKVQKRFYSVGDFQVGLNQDLQFLFFFLLNVATEIFLSSMSSMIETALEKRAVFFFLVSLGAWGVGGRRVMIAGK